VDWQEVFGDVPTDSAGIIDWLLTSVADTVVDEGIGFIKDQLESPFDRLIEPGLDAAGDATKGYMGDAAGVITSELGDL
jgi:hypothetical protein